MVSEKQNFFIMLQYKSPLRLRQLNWFLFPSLKNAIAKVIECNGIYLTQTLCRYSHLLIYKRTGFTLPLTKQRSELSLDHLNKVTYWMSFSALCMKPVKVNLKMVIHKIMILLIYKVSCIITRQCSPVISTYNIAVQKLLKALVPSVTPFHTMNW